MTEEDVKDLFSDIGPLKSSELTGEGTAEVVYVLRTHALDAIERYNGVPLDGKEMQLSLGSKSFEVSRLQAHLSFSEDFCSP